jgi:ribosome biogenesis GTPase
VVHFRKKCSLGQSGVGETSLLNRLLGREMFRVSEVREKDGKGRHTTVRRQLICLANGSIFINTPGMRELGNFNIEESLDRTFGEFASYTERCRFRDCTHTHEKGCALVQAVENGEKEESRYRNYFKLKKESAHYVTSYKDKRKREKAFGKIMKNYRRLNPKG